MPSEHLMRMIGRLEMLADEAEELVGKYPDMLKTSWSEGLFDSDYLREKRSAKARYEGIFSEVMGIVAAIKDCLRDYGQAIRNDEIGNAFHKVKTAKDAVSALRSAIGFLRSQAYRT